MDTVPYILMQDRLSTGGSFILCDCNANGFPIRYASAGFCDLFEYSAVECKGQKCGDLVAEPSIRASDPSLAGLSSAAGLPAEEAGKALSLIGNFAAKECKAMMAHPTQVTGFALVLNRTKTGALKVIELAMVVCRHPGAGWLYSVGLQTDVTDEVSLRQLFAAAGAGAGAYAELVKAQEPAMQARLRLLDIRSGSANRYLDVKATEMWESLMLDTLGVEVKALSAVSEFSTADGSSLVSSSEGTSSHEESDAASSKAQSVVGKPGALEKIFEVPVLTFDWKPQVSEASTFVPEQELQAFSRHGTDEVVVPNACDRGMPGSVTSPAAKETARTPWAAQMAGMAGTVGGGPALMAGAAVAAVASAAVAVMLVRRARTHG